MRAEIIRCDTCTKEHDAQYCLPAEWVTITGRGKYNEGDDQHFCSLKCLQEWVEKCLIAKQAKDKNAIQSKGSAWIHRES